MYYFVNNDICDIYNRIKIHLNINTSNVANDDDEQNKIHNAE